MLPPSLEGTNFRAKTSTWGLYLISDKEILRFLFYSLKFFPSSGGMTDELNFG
jgi:hypothetical protein